MIVGPIASGKTTIARALGARLRGAGRVTAGVDLDDSHEIAALLHAIPDDVEPRWLLLLCSLEIALDRARDASHRLMSKNPDVMRRAYDRFRELRSTMPLPEWTFNTETISATAVVDGIAADLGV